MKISSVLMLVRELYRWLTQVLELTDLSSSSVLLKHLGIAFVFAVQMLNV